MRNAFSGAQRNAPLHDKYDTFSVWPSPTSVRSPVNVVQWNVGKRVGCRQERSSLKNETDEERWTGTEELFHVCFSRAGCAAPSFCVLTSIR